MGNTRHLLTLLATGVPVSTAWKNSGFSSKKEMCDSLMKLAEALPPEVGQGLSASGALVVNTDGAARGNPGPASAAAVAYTASGEILASRSDFLGVATNNEAEYKALILGVRLAHDLKASVVHFRLDSELVVKQMKGEYRIKKSHLAVLADVVWQESSSFDRVEYEHIPREKNTEADKLANEVLDRLRKAEPDR